MTKSRYWYLDDPWSWQPKEGGPLRSRVYAISDIRNLECCTAVDAIEHLNAGLDFLEEHGGLTDRSAVRIQGKSAFRDTLSLVFERDATEAEAAVHADGEKNWKAERRAELLKQLGELDGQE